jgi:hypothetical protein
LGAFLALPRQKPGFPLQVLVPPAAVLRDFHCNPLRGASTQVSIKKISPSNLEKLTMQEKNRAGFF